MMVCGFILRTRLLACMGGGGLHGPVRLETVAAAMLLRVEVFGRSNNMHDIFIIINCKQTTVHTLAHTKH